MKEFQTVQRQYQDKMETIWKQEGNNMKQRQHRMNTSSEIINMKLTDLKAVALGVKKQ